MKKILSIFSSLVLLFSLIPNVRANGPTYAASGVEDNAATLSADKAFDNNFNTRWASDTANGEKTLSVTYPSPQTKRGFKIFWERNNVANFEIQAFVDDAWKTVYINTDSNQHVSVATFNEAVTASQFKLVIKEFSGIGKPQKTNFTANSNPFLDINWNTVSVYEFQLLDEAPQVEVGEKNVNIMRGAKVTKIGDLDEETSTFTIDKLTDGSTSTRWATNVGKKTGQIILEMPTIKKVQSLRFHNDPRASVGGPNVNALDVYGSVDGNLWFPVHRYTAIQKVTEDLSFDYPVNAKFFKLDFKGTQTSRWDNVSMSEIEAFTNSLSANVSLKTARVQLNETNTEVVLPQYDEDAVVTIVGSNADHVIDLTGKVHQPLVAKDVKITLQLVADGTKTTKEFTLRVPGKYSDNGVGSAPKVIPAVQEYHNVEGTTNIINDTSIIVSEEFKAQAEQYIQDVAARCVTVTLNNNQAPRKIYINKVTDKAYFDEGYYINIADDITIEAATSTGAWYGLVTLLHMGETEIQKGEIRDYPMYKERKFSLDTGRKFFPVPVVNEILKNMSYYKMNTLQMHLNDNFIWLERLSDRNNPNIDEVLEKMDPGFRIETSFKNEDTGVALTSKDHYTKAEFRKFVTDGAKLGVEVIPEIDSPGHAGSFVKMRPDLMYPDDNPSDPRNLVWRNKPKADRAAMLDLSKEDSYTLVTNVLKELVGTEENPGAFYDVKRLHIGTDEYYGSKEDYRRYVDRLLKFVKTNLKKTPKFWGSLTLLGGTTQVTNNAEMDVWSLGWNRLDSAINDGYLITNILDIPTYSVPAMNGLNNRNGGYTDFINNARLFRWDPTDFTGNNGGTLNQSHPQILGGGYALWNDMNTDFGDVGLTSYDLFDRFFEPLAVAAQKTWNSPTTDFASFTALARERGYAPLTDPKYTRNIDKTKPVLDVEQVFNTSEKQNVSKDNTKYVFNNGSLTTNKDYVGLDAILNVDVKLLDDTNNQALLVTGKDKFLLRDEEGYVAYEYDGRRIQFDYKIPTNEKVNIKLSTKQYETLLIVNGEEIERKTNVMKPNIAYTTFTLPIHKIGENLHSEIYRLAITNDTYVDPTILPHTIFTNARANSAQPGNPVEGSATYAFDNNPATFWHTAWRDFTVSESNPAILEVDLTEPQEVAALIYKPRPGGGNGTITNYQLFLKVGDEYLAEPVSAGTLPDNGNDKTIKFNQPYKNVTGLKLVVLAGKQNFASASEIVLKKPAVVEEETPVVELDTQALQAQYERYEALDKSLYTEESLAEVEEIADTIKLLLETPEELSQLTQEQINTITDGFKALLDAVQPKPILPKTTEVSIPENVMIDVEKLKSLLNTDVVADTISLIVVENENNIGEENAKLYDVVKAYDISILKNGKNVTLLPEPLRITLQLSQSQNKPLKVLRNHDGEFTVLNDLDDDASTVTFETDRFSEYTVVTDKEVSEQPNKPDVDTVKPTDPDATPSVDNETPSTPSVEPKQPIEVVKPSEPVVENEKPVVSNEEKTAQKAEKTIKQEGKAKVNTSDVNTMMYVLFMGLALLVFLKLTLKKQK